MDETDKLKLTLLKYCRQVAIGLNYLKGREIIHGALKASNILVSKDNTCKVMHNFFCLIVLVTCVRGYL